MILTPEQKNAYHTDGVCRVIEIKEHLIAQDIREALLKHAPFKILGHSEQYPSSVFADAYVAAIEAGDLEPVVFKESYDEMVHRKIHEQEVRRLQGENTIYKSGKRPFKKHGDAKELQNKYQLAITHNIVEVTGGFILERNSLSKQKELQDEANGLKSYEQLRSQAFAEIGLPETESEDGELVASDEQWAIIDARVNELQQKQRGF